MPVQVLPARRAGPGRVVRRQLRNLAEGLAFLGLFLVLALLGSLAGARAATLPESMLTGTVTPNDVTTGSLLLDAHIEGRYVAAPLVATDADVTVSGPTVRARISQIFHNPTKGWVEGVYVYPLPEGAAVDSLKMVIGNRVIVGDIKKREEAKAIYEKAKAEGKKASLVEQQRPNIFTNSVANIGPGETVIVQIEYQEPVRQAAERFSLRLPLVVAPRYHPRPAVNQTVDFRPGAGWGDIAAAPEPEKSPLDAPVLDPAINAPVNPVSITVRLQAGFALGKVESSFHDAKIEEPAPDRRVVTFADGVKPADRDFELTWAPVAGPTPAVGLFREKVGSDEYLLAFVTPPALDEGAARPRPREVTFVIDNSGSMGGTSMEQAKASLIYALERLKPEDRFNVIRFDDTMDKIFPDTVPADAENVGKARIYVSLLSASGGTEMIPPLRAALADPRPDDHAFVRQVVFLTDGAVSNEDQLFATITAMRGRSRVFMVGIGSAPNGFLMTRAAELGRGAFTQVGSDEQVTERMRSLFAKLENPAVTGLTARFEGTTADATPGMLPDIYRGEPLVLAARLGALKGNVTIGGTIGDQPWSVTLPLAAAAEGKGLSKLWARRKIDDAEVEQLTGRLTGEAADKRILDLALAHSLVTRLTSLVAVDNGPSRPANEPLTRAEVPLNLPAGWEFEKVFGTGGEPSVEKDAREAGRTGAIRVAAADVDLIATLAKPKQVMAGKPPVVLPQTATDAALRLWAGLVLLLTGALVALFGRRRRLA